MADFTGVTRTEVFLQKTVELVAGTRVVIVLNPSTFNAATDTGTILVDATVPAEKTLKNGVLKVTGELV